MFAVRGANEDPAGDRAFSHVFREGAADSRFAAQGQVSRPRRVLSARLPDAEHGEETDHAGDRDVIADPGDAAAPRKINQISFRSSSSEDFYVCFF
jgi:hypothetical protein